MAQSLIDKFFKDTNPHQKMPFSVKIINEISKEFKGLCHHLIERGKFSDFFLKKTAMHLDLDLSVLTNSEPQIVTELSDGEFIAGMMCIRNPIEIDGANGELQDWFILTDWPDTPLGKENRDSVFPIHYESILLCKSLRDIELLSPKGKKVLDAFCGSGIMGIYAAICGAKEVDLFDISPRSCFFSMLNLAINICLYEDTTFNILVSDVFKRIKSNDYDLILGNPPFEPVPRELREDYFVHSYGGEDGQLYTNKFLEQAVTRLKPDGYIVGVNFTPGFKRLDKGSEKREYALTNKTYDPGLKFVLRELDSIPIMNFASRYVALNLPSKDFQNWYDNLILKGYERLFFVWYCLSKKTDSDIRAADTKDLFDVAKNTIPTNWSNPIFWHYPCGITEKGSLQWTYLEDLFFVRDSVYAHQMRAEQMLSKGNIAEYFDTNIHKNDDDFKEFISHFNSELKEFCYGGIGKPDTILWMNFPDAKKPQSRGTLFLNKETQWDQTLDDLKSNLQKVLTDGLPTLIIFCEINDIPTDLCQSYVGDFASTSITCCIAESFKIHCLKADGRAVPFDLNRYLDAGLGKIICSTFGEELPASCLQTYCIVFQWSAPVYRDILDSIITNPDRVFLDGLFQRITFTVLQGVNSLAMVGLFKEKQKEQESSAYLRKINEIVDDLNRLFNNRKSGPRLKQSQDRYSLLEKFEAFGSQEIVPYFKYENVIQEVIDMAGELYTLSGYIGQTLKSVQPHNDWTADHDSLRHFLAWPGLCTVCETKDLDLSMFSCTLDLSTVPSHLKAVETCNSILTDSIINIFKNSLPVSEQKLNMHIQEMEPFIKYEAGGPLWHPLLGEAHKNAYPCAKIFWASYLRKHLKISKIQIAFPEENAQGTLIPFFAYVLAACFNLEVKKLSEIKLNFVHLEGGGVSLVAQWDTHSIYVSVRPVCTIESLLNRNDDSTGRVAGRLAFLSSIFPNLGGRGFDFSEDGKITTFEMVITK